MLQMVRQIECKKKSLCVWSADNMCVLRMGEGVFGATVWASVEGKVTVIDIFMLQMVRQIKCNKKNLCVQSTDNMCMYCKWGRGLFIASVLASVQGKVTGQWYFHVANSQAD